MSGHGTNTSREGLVQTVGDQHGINPSEVNVFLMRSLFVSEQIFDQPGRLNKKEKLKQPSLWNYPNI